MVTLAAVPGMLMGSQRPERTTTLSLHSQAPGHLRTQLWEGWAVGRAILRGPAMSPTPPQPSDQDRVSERPRSQAAGPAS